MTDEVPTESTDDEVNLPADYHKRGCPGIEDDERIEWYEAVITTQGHPNQGKTVEITRCPDCGGRKIVVKGEGQEVQDQ